MAHDSTIAYLAKAQQCVTDTHAPTRTAVRQAAATLGDLTGSVALQRAALTAAQIDETDAGVVGTFYEADDILKTINRLGGEVSTGLMALLRVMDRHEAMIARQQGLVAKLAPADAPVAS